MGVPSVEVMATPRTTHRGTQVTRSIFAAVAVTIVLALGYLFGYRLNITTAHIALPTAAATPEQVVSTYVDAYDHRDWKTMAAIYPNQIVDRHRTIGTMTDLTVVSSQALAGPEDGNPAHSGVSYYKVRVTLQLHDLTGSDFALKPGLNGWAYLLERRGPGEPWHIAARGNP